MWFSISPIPCTKQRRCSVICADFRKKTLVEGDSKGCNGLSKARRCWDGNGWEIVLQDPSSSPRPRSLRRNVQTAMFSDERRDKPCHKPMAVLFVYVNLFILVMQMISHTLIIPATRSSWPCAQSVSRWQPTSKICVYVSIVETGYPTELWSMKFPVVFQTDHSTEAKWNWPTRTPTRRIQSCKKNKSRCKSPQVENSSETFQDHYNDNDILCYVAHHLADFSCIFWGHPRVHLEQMGHLCGGFVAQSAQPWYRWYDWTRFQ